jgi:hypothetical protein
MNEGFFQPHETCAIDDFKLFFEPYVAVWKGARSLFKFIKDKAKQAMK